MKFMQISHDNDNKLKFVRKYVSGFIVPMRLLKNHYILVMKDDVGNYLSMIYYCLDKPEGKCFINYIHTNPDHLRKGYATMIVREMQKQLSKIVKQFELMVLPGSNFDKLFKKCGFVFDETTRSMKLNL